jgi:predicted XRE-type DNA-binding protein
VPRVVEKVSRDIKRYIMRKVTKKTPTKRTKKEFEKYLERIEDPNYQGEENHDLPENPTPLQVAKFDICQKILAYKRKNDLTREQIAQTIQLSKAETEEILFCHIEKFTLDRLVSYASKLFNPLEVKVVKARSRVLLSFKRTNI